MADLKNQKRLAASVMKVGASRVRLDPDRGDEIASAVTRADVRKLVDGGVITAVQKTGVSRGRGRKLDQDTCRADRDSAARRPRAHGGAPAARSTTASPE